MTRMPSKLPLTSTLLAFTIGCRAPGDVDDTPKDSAADTGSVDTSDTDTTETGESGTDTATETGDTAGDTDTGPETGDTEETAGETGDTGVEVVRTPVSVDVEAEADAKLVGEVPGASQGLQIGRVGDLNGDGFDDVVVGAPNVEPTSGNYGRAYVLYGPSIVSRVLSATDPHWDASAWDGLGRTLHGGGDLNGDGIDDLLVACPSYAEGTESPGRVAVLYGPPSAETDIETAANAFIVGDWVYNYYAPTSFTGSSLDAVGDVDGDGNDDIVIGAAYYDLNGADYLVSGPITGNLDLTTDWTFRLTESGQAEIAGAGDTNGDGMADLILGALADQPAATVFLGPVSGDMLHSDADVTINSRVGAPAGEHPRGVGDVNGDGYDDVVVDDYANSDILVHAGAAWLFLGPLAADEEFVKADAGLVGAEEDILAGHALDAAGDANADGYADILVGAPESGSTAAPGAAYLVLGPVYGTLMLDGADYTFTGSGDDFLGTQVAGAGDIDGDGLDDLLLSGPGDDDGGTDAGAAWLMLAKNL